MQRRRHVSTTVVQVVLLARRYTAVSPRCEQKSIQANSNPEILAVLLNDGKSPKTGVQILQKSTVDEMFRNQIPEFLDFGRQGIPDSKKWPTNALPDLYPVANSEPQG